LFLKIINYTCLLCMFIFISSSCSPKEITPVGEGIKDSCGNSIQNDVKLHSSIIFYENQDEFVNKLYPQIKIIPWERERAGMKASEYAEVSEIIKNKPDAVIAMTDHMDERSCTISRKLHEAGIQPLFFEYRTVGQLEVVIQKLGQIIGKDKVYMEWLNDLEKSKEKVRNAIGESEPKKVYWELAFQNDQTKKENQAITLAQDSFFNDVLRLAGGTNIADAELSDRENSYRLLSEKDIVRADPDIIFITKGSTERSLKAQLMERNNWPHIKAVKNDKIFEIEQETYYLVHVAESLLWMAEHINPDKFTGK